VLIETKDYSHFVSSGIGVNSLSSSLLLLLLLLLLFFVVFSMFYIFSHHVSISGAFLLTVCAHCLTFRLPAAVNITLNSVHFVRAALPSCANNK
jgi:hypothetical protein